MFGYRNIKKKKKKRIKKECYLCVAASQIYPDINSECL